MLEPKIALMRQIVFTHAARRLTDSLYTQIIVEGKIDDQLAEIEPCVFAALGCKDPATVGAECLKSAMADMKDSVQLGFDRAEQKMVECKDEIKDEVKSGVATVCEKVEEVDAKVSKLKCRGKRRGKYDKASVQCLMIWERERADTTLRNTLNTRVTYEVVFERNKRELAELGIDSLAKFKKVIHAAQSKRSSDGIKALHSKQDAARSKPPRKMV